MRINQTVNGRKINSKGVWTPVVVLDPGHSAVVAGGYEPLGPGSSQLKEKDTSGTQGVATGVEEYKLNLSIGLRERVCQDDFCKFSKFKYLSAEKSPNISCLHIS